MRIWIEFIYLQALDFLTTRSTIAHGQDHLNPLVGWMLRQEHPVSVFLLVKVLCVLCAALSTLRSRHEPVQILNLVFAGINCCNLVLVLLPQFFG